MIGRTIGPYQVVAKLGEGGMGEVYRARDSKLKRDVAIKVLPADVAGDRERLARFQREAEVLASLNHPHIAHVYGIEENALVMELVEGEDLSQRISRGPIPIDEALPIAKQIAEALEAAHEAGIVHRDLKPANIKVKDDGVVKVLDFGLAKALDQGSGAGVILGTAAYMAPVQPDDDRPGAAVAVLSHSLRRKRFAADPTAVGRAMLLEGRPHTIVGVMPSDFAFPEGVDV